MRHSKICILTVTIFFLALNINHAEASRNTCSVPTQSGNRTVNYAEYYVQLHEFYANYQNLARERGSFAELGRNIQMEAAKHWIKSCPDFYKNIVNDIMPHEAGGTGSNIGDAALHIFGEAARPSQMRRIRDQHPQFKRWLNRANRR